MKKVELVATKRASEGTKGATTIRRAKRVPCVLYGGADTVHFSVDEAALRKLVYTPESYRIELDIDGEKRMTLRGDGIATEFQAIVENYIKDRFGASTSA